MFNFASHLQWFQTKIGSYDKQIWETSVEQRILQGLENRPKREGCLHKELIDIDLVRGSTFSKAKPRHGLKSVIFNGLKRVIFFPYYYNQWREHLNKEVVYFFTFHYILQFIQLILYFFWSNSTEIMLEEILLPIVFALCLGVLHAHIIAPFIVKQRRIKTYSFSNSKLKNGSSTESPLLSTPNSRHQSLQSNVVLQLSESPQKSSKENSKPDVVQTCRENPLCKRIKTKSVLFKKSSHSCSISSDEEELVIAAKTMDNGAYDGETETKDSSFSEHELLFSKNVDEEEKNNETNDVCGQDVFLSNTVLKTNPKKVKVSETAEKSAAYDKGKTVLVRCGHSESVTLSDEEDLKKFITAKNKHIPDPTPINNFKKEKDKISKKGSFVVNQKIYKSSKCLRQGMDCVGNNSEISSGNTSTSNLPCAQNYFEISKADKSAMTDSSIIWPQNDICADSPFNGNVFIQDTGTDDSNDAKTSTTETIKTLESKKESIRSVLQVPSIDKSGHSVSQPHTPLNHARSKIRCLEVRKISSADVSPTLYRKNIAPFIFNHDFDKKCTQQMELINHTNSEEPLDTVEDLDNVIDQPREIVDKSISSEDFFLNFTELNEDTITKRHKQREEFQQLFVKKAQSIQIEKEANLNSESKNGSSTSSNGNIVPERKHSKVRRRHREDSKCLATETCKKGTHRTEMVQSMSETEYDRMNSDVNSTGNSSSDAEDICPKVLTTKSELEVMEVPDSKKEIYEEDNIIEIGDSSNIFGKIESNAMTEEKNRAGDIQYPEIESDDPFILWYREAHAPGSLHGMTGSVSCYIWENDELKKTNLSLLDIGWSIIQSVERHVQDQNYTSLGFVIIMALCFTPLLFRIYVNRTYIATVVEMSRQSTLVHTFLPQSIFSVNTSVVLENNALGDRVGCRVYSWFEDIIPLALTSILASEWPIRIIIIFGVILRITLYTTTFLLLCVAENSFEQRLQYAKHFCRLTSSRRARKYYLPHFRLNKLANIKCWLSLRSYLKKRGPQRSVESIISSAFYMLLAMLSLVCINLLQSTDNLFINRLINWDLMICSLVLGIFMMRFLVLGTKITKKYRNLSVIITEQINLFLAMQTRPHKKEELTLAHNVLRLAESLLKEVEGPFRVCGWSMNPFLYNILKVVILSVLSTVLSDTCGFKMKLYKIKINPANW